MMLLKKISRFVAGLMLALATLASQAAPSVEMQTSMGMIVIELDSEKAPISVKNFLQYAKDGYYNGTIFHRVIDGFMIQGGGFTKDMGEKPTGAQVPNEAKNGLKNPRGTFAMARRAGPHAPAPRGRGFPPPRRGRSRHGRGPRGARRRPDRRCAAPR